MRPLSFHPVPCDRPDGPRDAARDGRSAGGQKGERVRRDGERTNSFIRMCVHEQALAHIF